MSSQRKQQRREYTHPGQASSKACALSSLPRNLLRSTKGSPFNLTDELHSFLLRASLGQPYSGHAAGSNFDFPELMLPPFLSQISQESMRFTSMYFIGKTAWVWISNHAPTSCRILHSTCLYLTHAHKVDITALYFMRIRYENIYNLNTYIPNSQSKTVPSTTNLHNKWKLLSLPLPQKWKTVVVGIYSESKGKPSFKFKIPHKVKHGGRPLSLGFRHRICPTPPLVLNGLKTKGSNAFLAVFQSMAEVSRVYKINSFLSRQWVKSEPSLNQPGG